MDQLTTTVWRAISDPDALGFFLDLLEGADGPEIAESLRDWFQDESEKIEWDESVPSVLPRMLQDSLDLVEWELIARKWRDLESRIEEFRAMEAAGGQEQ